MTITFGLFFNTLPKPERMPGIGISQLASRRRVMPIQTETGIGSGYKNAQ